VRAGIPPINPAGKYATDMTMSTKDALGAMALRCMVASSQGMEIVVR